MTEIKIKHLYINFFPSVVLNNYILKIPLFQMLYLKKILVVCAVFYT